MVRVTVNDDEVAMNGYEGGVPESAAGEGKCQLRVESTHHLSGSPTTPHVRVNDHHNHEEQSAQTFAFRLTRPT